MQGAAPICGLHLAPTSFLPNKTSHSQLPASRCALREKLALNPPCQHLRKGSYDDDRAVNPALACGICRFSARRVALQAASSRSVSSSLFDASSRCPIHPDNPQAPSEPRAANGGRNAEVSQHGSLESSSGDKTKGNSGAKGWHDLQGMPRGTLGVDFGLKRTGVAVSFGGFAPRAIDVLQAAGPKLVSKILEIAQAEQVSEIVVGLPVSLDGSEGPQAAKCRDFAQFLAREAAAVGSLRVLLFDEYNSSQDALAFMIKSGEKQKTRREKLDAYAARALLEAYFANDGAGAVVVVPKKKRRKKGNLGLQPEELQQPTTMPRRASSDFDDEDDWNSKPDVEMEEWMNAL